MSVAERIAIRLQEAEHAYSDAMDRLGRDVRDFVVKPYCDRRGFTFAAGNGSWSFYDKAREPVFGNALPRYIRDVLEQPTLYAGGQDLATMVPDYPEGWTNA